MASAPEGIGNLGISSLCIHDFVATINPVLLLLAAATLWMPPKPVEVAPPKAPYTYLREDSSGTQPKLFVRDASNRAWNVKFGFEVHTESFCWRIVRPAGISRNPASSSPKGSSKRYRPLKRRTDAIKPDGSFREARFQFRDPGVTFLKDRTGAGTGRRSPARRSSTASRS